jgi:hypothetical protein
MTGTVWVLRAAGLMLHVAIWALAQWGRLCVGFPMRVWWWIWRRPLPLWRRVHFAVGPWLFLGLAAAPWIYVDYVRREGPVPTPALQAAFLVAYPIVRLEREAIAGVVTGAESLVSPWESTAQSALPRGARSTRSRSQRAAMRPPAEILARQAVVLAVALVGLPFAILLVFGGPVLVPVLIIVRGRGGATVSGRALRNVSPRRFPHWRGKGDARGRWFVGASATNRGPLWLADEARLMHTWVVGATGTGKTQSVLLPALRSDILAGRTAIFIDGKGDRETLSAVWNLAQEAGREGDFRYFDLRRPQESHTYSPLLNGTPNEQVDKIMAALRWDNEFYRAQSKTVLLRVLRSLRATGLPYSLDDVLAAFSNLAALRALADALQDVDCRAELEHIAGRWKDYLVETSGLRSQLEALLMTDFGELLKTPQPTLDLAEAYQAGAIVYFALPVARFPETAPLVAKLIISDLNSVAGMVQDGQLDRGFASIVIDEFAAFAMPLFVDLLNKGRSAGMAITISHQSMRGDLAAAERGFVDQIADNTNVKICLRQSADAEYVAGLSGTYKTIKRTEQTLAAMFGHERTGLGSAREVDEYHVSPNLIRQLPQGYAVVQINVPATLDLVRLDYLASSAFRMYSPPPQERGPSIGLDLRKCAARRLPSSPPVAPAALMFEGA